MEAIIPRPSDEARSTLSKLSFDVQARNLDRQGGTFSDVIILEMGEARGHKMMISDMSIDAAENLLSGATLPAFISHDGAFNDRLLSEIGVFTGFYRDKDKIRSRKFEILPSFKTDEPEKFNRLFDLAERIPDSFGISIVFEGQLFWETSTELIDYIGQAAPDDALFDVPTIVPARISSADFVDTPAATSALFSESGRDKETNSREMNNPVDEIVEEVMLNESASAELEKRKAAEEAGDQPAPEEKSPPKKASKKKLEEPVPVDPDEENDESEDASEDSAEEALSELPHGDDERVAARDQVIQDQQVEIEELKRTIDTLRKVFSGHDEIEDDLAVEPVEESPEEAKMSAISEYLEKNPSHSRMTAVLEVAKNKPELFNLN